MLTVLQEAVRPKNLVICDSHNLASGLLEALGLLVAVTSDALLEMDDLDDFAVRGGQVVGLDGRENSLDWEISASPSQDQHKTAGYTYSSRK